MSVTKNTCNGCLRSPLLPEVLIGKWHCGGQPLVESDALVQGFSPGSTLEPGLKAFRRRGPKCKL
jgi:hypothetical protein